MIHYDIYTNGDQRPRVAELVWVRAQVIDPGTGTNRNVKLRTLVSTEYDGNLIDYDFEADVGMIGVDDE